MLLGLATILVLASVPLAGGRLSRLAAIHIEGGAHLTLALALQVLVIEIIPDTPAPMPALAHVTSYVLVAYAVWLNRRLPHLWIVALGGTLNALAIEVNHGIMPARAGALAAAGLRPEHGEFANSTTVAHPHLAFLGDVFATPSNWPAANVFSVGDVVIVLGLAAFLHAWCQSSPGAGVLDGRTVGSRILAIWSTRRVH